MGKPATSMYNLSSNNSSILDRQRTKNQNFTQINKI